MDDSFVDFLTWLSQENLKEANSTTPNGDTPTQAYFPPSKPSFDYLGTLKNAKSSIYRSLMKKHDSSNAKYVYASTKPKTNDYQYNFEGDPDHIFGDDQDFLRTKRPPVGLTKQSPAPDATTEIHPLHRFVNSVHNGQNRRA